jgi:hypothetical protein
MLGRRALWSLVTVLAVVPALSACRTTAVGLEDARCGGPADSLLTLCVGQEVFAPDGVMRVALLGVRNDSRCPVDVVCIWEGNAEVDIGVAFGLGPTAPYVLNTGGGGAPRSVDIGTYRLTLVELRPAPVSTTRIPPDGYVASLRVEHLAAGVPAAGGDGHEAGLRPGS